MTTLLRCIVILLCVTGVSQAQIIQGGSSGSTASTNAGVTPEAFGAKGDGVQVDDSTPTPSCASTGATTGTTAATNTINTAQANDIVISAYAYGSTASSWTPPSTPTQRAAVAAVSGSKQGLWVGDEAAATAAQYSESGTLGSAVSSAGAIAAIAPSGGTATFIAANATTSASGASVTTNVPAGTQNGDLIIGIAAEGSNLTQAGTFISGFTLATANMVNAAPSLAVYYRIASSEPASYTLNSVAAAQGLALLTYRNATLEQGIASLQAAWAAGDVGKAACMDGVSATLGYSYANDLCGTISSVTNSHLLVPSFQSSMVNGYVPSTLTDASSLGLEFRYGTDDSTALQNAINSLVTGTAGTSTTRSSGGGTVALGRKNYVITSGLTIPAELSFVIAGQGRLITRYGYSSQSGWSGPSSNTYNNGGGSAIWVLTHGLSGAAIRIASGTSLTHFSQQTHDVLQQFTLWAGAGFHGQGGGHDGIDLSNVYGTVLRDLVVGDFTGDGVNYSSPSNASTNYNALNSIEDTYITGNRGNGIHIDTTNGTQQNFSLFNTNVESNGSNGILIDGSGTLYGFSIFGTNIIDRNDWLGNGSTYEINLTGATMQGCSIMGVYAEELPGAAVTGALGGGGQCFVGPGVVFNGETWPAGTNGMQTGFIKSGVSPSISSCGTGTLGTGSSSVTGTVTMTGATTCVLTPGVTCANVVNCMFTDGTTLGGAKGGSKTTTSETITATSGDVVDYFCGCR